ncbi:MAG: ABC transporter ATP-binding protein [Beijerinckiaceae bacterium]
MSDQNHCFISIRSISKAFGPARAVDDVSLDIAKGEFFSLLGPSGCGKTTLMRMIAGFEQPESGSLSIAGEDMIGMPAHLRPVNMMFQSYALFPHMSVRNNIAFGLKQMKLPAADVTKRTSEMLSLVQLDSLADRMPDQLSGGQKQRVALARALARQPKVLLLDEPLGALDKTLRKETQSELKRIQSNLGTTFIVVTHDQEEAMTLSDRIAVMQAGRIVQTGTPAELYQQPANRFVAGFLGEVNSLDVKVVSHKQGMAVVECADFDGPVTVPFQDYNAGGLGLILRPEHLGFSRPEAVSGAVALPVTIVEQTYLGATVSVTTRTRSGRPLHLTVPASRQGQSLVQGAQAFVHFNLADARLLAS